MFYKAKLKKQRISYKELRSALLREVEAADWFGMVTEEEMMDQEEDSLREGQLMEIGGYVYGFAEERLRKRQKNRAAVALGSIKSERKARAARENGKKGGRPVTENGKST